MSQALVCLLLSSSSSSFCVEFQILHVRYGSKSIKCHFSLVWCLEFTVRKNEPTAGQVCLIIYTPVIVLISEEDYGMDQNLLLNQIQRVFIHAWCSQ